MLEYQSLKWNKQLEACACESVTPVCFERDFTFFYQKEKGTIVTTFEFLSANGDKIDELQNEDTIENDAFGFAYLPLSNRIAIGDYFRIKGITRFASKTPTLQSFNASTDDSRIINILQCGGGIPALQLENPIVFNAEKDCYLEITAFVELTDSVWNSIVYNETTARIYKNCADVTKIKQLFKQGENVSFEIALPNLDTSKNYIYLDIRYYFNIYDVEYSTIGISSLMQRVSIDDFSQVNFNCTNDEFGFPFSLSGSFVSNIMPIKLSKPQYSQNDKIYTKSNGENVVLFSEMVKEYEGMTDYVSEKMHEMILIALSCDEVIINGERLTKSDKYEIDWDNYTTDDSGEKLARATFKMKANVNKRNSNC